MPAKPFHMGWFMSGFRVLGWRDPWIGTHARDAMLADFYVDFARSLERACFDFFISADSSYVPDAWQGSHDWYVRNAEAVPKYDPAVYMSILTQSTERIGIVPTLSVTEYPPYLLARLVSTLDHVSKGRAGWNIGDRRAPTGPRRTTATRPSPRTTCATRWPRSSPSSS